MLKPEEVAEAQEALSILIGLPLTDMFRYFEFQKFEFGEQNPHLNDRGEETTWSDWGLVVACEWQVEGPDGFVLGHLHFGPGTRTDHNASSFYELMDSDPLVVEEVQVHLRGAASFRLTRGYSLVLDPRSRDVEYWRFMPPEGDPRGHLVFADDGLEWSGKHGEITS